MNQLAVKGGDLSRKVASACQLEDFVTSTSTFNNDTIEATSNTETRQTAPSQDRCRLLINNDMRNAIYAVKVTGVLWRHYGHLLICVFLKKHSENSITVEKTRRNKYVMFHSVWICLYGCSIDFCQCFRHGIFNRSLLMSMSMSMSTAIFSVSFNVVVDKWSEWISNELINE